MELLALSRHDRPSNCVSAFARKLHTKVGAVAQSTTQVAQSIQVIRVAVAKSH